MKRRDREQAIIDLLKIIDRNRAYTADIAAALHQPHRRIKRDLRRLARQGITVRRDEAARDG